MRRTDLLSKVGVTPSIGTRVSAALAAAIEDAQRASPDTVTALDAGCGRKSPLARFRPRIARLVGVDLHEPSAPLPWLDEFVRMDLCSTAAPLPSDSFDLVLSNFTLEHFAEPGVALDAFFRCLRPGGTLVITTVNRGHPFVAAYLEMPDRLRRRAQPVLKASAADAHPLVGACNDPTRVREALLGAGFEDVRMEFVANLARSWQRHWWTFSLGLLGDVLTLRMPARRSTILAVGRRPSP